mgnify:CR=1 FL=1
MHLFPKNVHILHVIVTRLIVINEKIALMKKNLMMQVPFVCKSYNKIVWREE